MPQEHTLVKRHHPVESSSITFLPRIFMTLPLAAIGFRVRRFKSCHVIILAGKTGEVAARIQWNEWILNGNNFCSLECSLGNKSLDWSMKRTSMPASLSYSQVEFSTRTKSSNTVDISSGNIALTVLLLPVLGGLTLVCAWAVLLTDAVVAYSLATAEYKEHSCLRCRTDHRENIAFPIYLTLAYHSSRIQF